MKRSGVADLPLHGGRVPQWVAQRMTKLGTAITEPIVHDYGTSAFLFDFLRSSLDGALPQKSFASALPPDVRRGFASPLT